MTSPVRWTLLPDRDLEALLQQHGFDAEQAEWLVQRRDTDPGAVGIMTEALETKGER